MIPILFGRKPADKPVDSAVPLVLFRVVEGKPDDQIFRFRHSRHLAGLLLSTGNTALAQVDGADPSLSSPKAHRTRPNQKRPRSGRRARDLRRAPTRPNPLFLSRFSWRERPKISSSLDAKERLKLYSEDLFSPFHILMGGAAAGITQAQNVPPEWGQGAVGYGRRFANYYAYAPLATCFKWPVKTFCMRITFTTVPANVGSGSG